MDLNKEREDIGKESAAFEAEKAKITAASEEAVRTYNAKATATDARVSHWNERNAKWNDSSVALEAERKTWVGNCADRRYREDDEKAIRDGR